MDFNIQTTLEFEKKFKILDNSIKTSIQKVINQLKINPYLGKPLGYKFFREKKVKNFRVYYLVFDDVLIVLLVGLSNKKNQKEVINNIKKLMSGLKEEFNDPKALFFLLLYL